MRPILFAGVLTFSLAVLPIACTAEEKTAAPEKPDGSTKLEIAQPADVAEVVNGNNEFAFDLYRQLAKNAKPDENIVFSPYSISTALAMTYGGARGQTAEQMAKVLHFSLPQERLHPAFGDLLADLHKDDKSRPYQFHVANALWGQEGLPFAERFLRLTETNYRAGLKEVDFEHAAEDGRKTINRWVEDQTRDKIKDLLLPGNVNKYTRLVLTNAIYYKAKWKTAFPKDQTKDAVFEVAPDEKRLVPMMHHAEQQFRYFAGDDYQWLELPYKGDRLSMLVLLPQKKGRLGDLEKTLTASAIQKGLAQLQHQLGNVALPRFKITLRVGLREELERMGMPFAFSGEADFSGIASVEGLRITGVFHKAYIDVDEVGTEAAAATAVVVGGASIVPHFSLRADHPFVFLIRDNQTGSIMFMGRVTDPRR